MSLADTIAAIATPGGTGGLGVIRISGPQALEVAGRVFCPRSGEPLRAMRGYTARYGGMAADGRPLDEGVALVFRAPHSYTGEDVVELMCHGGEQVCASVLRAVLDAGATMAGPGEFTRRAFVNGRISLTEAEAVCDLIGAASAGGQAAAVRLAGGALHRKTQELAGQLMDIQAHLSAALDFPEEDVEEIEPAALLGRFSALEEDLSRLVEGYETGVAVLRGITVVIAGSPNVGKSTLLNRLAGAEKAIVTPIPGTTRDVVEQRVLLGGTALLLADTAGIRQGADAVERIGVERAMERMEQADVILAVFDGSRPLDPDDREVIRLTRQKRCLGIINKGDLPSLIEEAEIAAAFPRRCTISANDPACLGVMDRALAALIGADRLSDDQPIVANERQRACAVRALDAVREGAGALRAGALDAAYALGAEALQAIGELDGKDAAEEVLDQVFSRFCVGK